MNEKEDYVSLEQAKLLKEKGYSQKINYLNAYFYADENYDNGNWKSKKGELYSNIYAEALLIEGVSITAAPSIYQAHKWLTKTKNTFIEIGLFEKGYAYWIKDTKNNTNLTGKYSQFYHSPEEALSKGIDKALNLI